MIEIMVLLGCSYNTALRAHMDKLDSTILYNVDMYLHVYICFEYVKVSVVFDEVEGSNTAVKIEPKSE